MSKAIKPNLQITQVISDTQLVSIGQFEVETKFARLLRVFGGGIKPDVPHTAGEVWLDELIDGDTVGDPIRITASQALWLCETFFKMPKSWYSKLKTTEQVQP